MGKSFYLDAGATTPVSNGVYDAMLPYFKDKFYNPSAEYMPSYNVSKEIEKARAYIADYMGCLPNEVYFTSGASESNSWAIQGWIRSHPNGRVLISNIEHHSIMAIEEDPFYEKYIDIYPVNHDGHITLDEIYDVLERCCYACNPEDILVSIQYANNEIGTIQDVLTIAGGVKDFGANVFSDATQMFADGGFELGFSRNIDMMSMSGHKIGAPKGIGILLVKNEIDLPPLIYGTQNFGKRGGTENVPYIIGLKEAFMELATQNIDRNKIVECRDLLFSEINKITPIKMNGDYDRLANNLNITFEKEIYGVALMAILSALDTFISIGSACNARSGEISHVLNAIGVSEEDAMRTVRITLPKDIKKDDITEIVEKFKTAIELLDR